MAKWQSKLDLRDIWNSVDDGKMTIQQLSAEVGNRVKKLQPCTDDDILWERDDIADEFQMLSEDSEITSEDFNYTMSRLYDWADTKLDNDWNGAKVCWISTFF